MSCPSANAAIVHNCGSDYGFAGSAVNLVNGVTDFTGWQIASHVKTTGHVLVEALDVQWLDEAQGIFEARSVTDTSGWPAGRLLTDIRLTTPAGDAVHTDQRQVLCRRAVTI